jgi:hypothetical protein
MGRVEPRCGFAAWAAVESDSMNHPIIDFVMQLLSFIFLVGMAGSAVVVAISFVEDLYELFGE